MCAYLFPCINLITARATLRVILFQTFWTEAVAEHGIRVYRNVFSQPLPNVPVVTDLVAMHTDGQYALQCLDMRHCHFELIDSFFEGKPKLANSLTNLYACLQFILVKK